MNLAVIIAEGHVFTQDVAVAGFEFPNEPALFIAVATENLCRAAVVTDTGKQQAVLAERAEHRTKLFQVSP